MKRFESESWCRRRVVATKIEFYVGDVPDGLTPSLQSARYTRLGSVVTTPIIRHIAVVVGCHIRLSASPKKFGETSRKKN